MSYDVSSNAQPSVLMRNHEKSDRHLQLGIKSVERTIITRARCIVILALLDYITCICID